MSDHLIRAASSKDAGVIAQIHVQAWQETYRGLMPQAFIERQSVAQRRAMWERILGDPASSSTVVVAEIQGVVVGFASGGPSRSDDGEADVELYAIYVLKAHHRKGLGGALCRQLLGELAQKGAKRALIWVLDGNAGARRFYEALGAVVCAHKVDERGDVSLREVGYSVALPLG